METSIEELTKLLKEYNLNNFGLPKDHVGNLTYGLQEGTTANSSDARVTYKPLQGTIMPDNLKWKPLISAGTQSFPALPQIPKHPYVYDTITKLNPETTTQPIWLLKKDLEILIHLLEYLSVSEYDDYKKQDEDSGQPVANHIYLATEKIKELLSKQLDRVRQTKGVIVLEDSDKDCKIPF